MKTPVMRITFFLCIMIVTALACDLPQKSPGSGLSSVHVSPKSAYAGEFVATIQYFWRMGDTDFTISCSYPDADGNYMSAATIPLQHDATSTEVPFNVTKPGTYNFSCSDSGATVDVKNVSMVEVFTVLEPALPAQPTTTEQQPAQNGESNPACHWVVAGMWNVHQTNGYNPVFDIQQDGNTLTGTATLSAAEATMGGYSGTWGMGQGSVTGDQFTFSVTWPPKTSNGEVVTGVYSGTITQGRISEPNQVWYATGTSQCVSP